MNGVPRPLRRVVGDVEAKVMAPARVRAKEIGVTLQCPLRFRIETSRISAAPVAGDERQTLESSSRRKIRRGGHVDGGAGGEHARGYERQAPGDHAGSSAVGTVRALASASMPRWSRATQSNATTKVTQPVAS